MEVIRAYKCRITNAVFENERDAAACEFRAMMAQAGGCFAPMGSVAPAAIMQWLAGQIESKSYRRGYTKLVEALKYFDANRCLLDREVDRS